jgi:hypothetical protein
MQNRGERVGKILPRQRVRSCVWLVISASAAATAVSTASPGTHTVAAALNFVSGRQPPPRTTPASGSSGPQGAPSRAKAPPGSHRHDPAYPQTLDGWKEWYRQPAQALPKQCWPQDASEVSSPRPEPCAPFAHGQGEVLLPQCLDDFDRRGGLTTGAQTEKGERVLPTHKPKLSGERRREPACESPGNQHRWLLLRHGQTNFNADGRVQGSSDQARLSEEGRRQAQEVGQFLKTFDIDRIFVSPLSRAQETLHEAEQAAGKPFVGGNSTEIMRDLREVDLHEWEGLYKKQIKEHWPEIYAQWRGDHPRDFRLLSGQYPIRDLWERAGDRSVQPPNPNPQPPKRKSYTLAPKP